MVGQEHQVMRGHRASNQVISAIDTQSLGTGVNKSCTSDAAIPWHECHHATRSHTLILTVTTLCTGHAARRPTRGQSTSGWRR